MNSLVLKKWLQKPLVLAVLLNFAALLISLLLSNGKFSSLDDHFMAMALTGAYGGGFDPHLYFVNSVYAYFLWPFYKLFPGVGWYTIFQMVSIFAAFTTISFVVLKKCGLKLGALVSVMLITCVSTDFYLHVAFTQCAGALTAAGILLLAFADQGKDESRKIRYLQLALGVLLAVGGFVMRKEMFLLGMPTLCVVLFINFVKNRSIYKPTIVALLALVACVAGLKTFDKAQFAMEGYDYYAAYQPVRAVFGDGAYFDGESLADEMDEIGVGSRDLRYLKAWYFYDKKVYSLDSLNKKNEMVKRHVFVPNYAKIPIAVLREIANEVLTGHFWCWAFLCIALVFFQRGLTGLVSWASLGMIFLSYTYLLLVNRVVGHVESGIWIYAVVILLTVFNANFLGKLNLQRKFIVAVCVICAFGCTCAAVDKAFEKRENNFEDVTTKTLQWNSFWEYAKKHNDDVFLLPFDRYKGFAKYIANVFVTYEPDSWNNIVSLGYWNVLFPPIEKELAKRGVSNPMRDIVNGNVYVLDDDTKMSLAPFYDEHYHKRLTIDTIETFGDISLLKYRLLTGEAENEEH